MPRPIRIALTLFASATVMVFLVWQELTQLRADRQSVGPDVPDDIALHFQQKGEMITLGLLIAGALACGGFVLVIFQILKRRQKAADHEG